ncbi:phage protease [Deefgea piscis]|uniref:phage protease n=1 Tax=Deefgea piscis TaxID=2739061 RepID=UPI001C7E967A|nr:phage protease [Deefgea piscis]QZA80855.1 phage protease [Deefgea piscis]
MGKRIIKLSASNTPTGTVRFLSGLHVKLGDGEGQKPTWITLTRTGSFTDPRYGRFEISRDMLLAMVKNFDANTVGQDVFIDVNHEPSKGAAAKVQKLAVEGDRLRALVDWSPYGIDAVKNKGYAYLSAEYHENFTDNEAGNQHGCTLLGAGLTVRPVIKRLDPVKLSESETPVLLHPELQSTLLAEIHAMWKEKIDALRKKLLAQGLSTAAVETICNAALKTLTEAHIADEAQATVILSQLESGAIALSQQLAAGGTLQLSLTAPAPAASTVDIVAEVAKALSAARDADAAAVKKLAEDKTSAEKMLADTINAASGIDDASKKTLAERGNAMLMPGWGEAQIKTLATMLIESGNQTAVAKQLASLGYGPTGSLRISVPDEGAKQLSGTYRDHLKQTATYGAGQLKLAEKTTPFVEMVLSEFDRINGAAIAAEMKMLAGGETNMSRGALPIGFQREVIREALSDLNILQLINTLTDFAATATTQIPYEYRDVSGVLNDGIVYEGQGINYATINQAMDTAYVVPMKVAYIITNEMAHFSRASAINWDAMARNIEVCARVMRELIAKRIANELQRSSDAYNAVAVSAENIASQLDGTTKSTIKSAGFPIVRPFQAFNLQGIAVGSAENPIVVKLNNIAVLPWDGSGSQPAATYYRVNSFNMGYIQFVNKDGAPVTPPNTGVCTIDYSRATNLLKVDLDVPGGSTLEKQLNKALQGVGAQKAMMSGQRFIQPDFALMSPTLNDTISNAEQFINMMGRNGTSTDGQGDLQSIKGIPAFGTNAPGIDLGDQRILMGQRGQLTYTVAKPFSLGEPFEVVNAQGQAVGKKQAYGEEYNAIKLPTPIRNRLTSVLVYSFSGR